MKSKIIGFGESMVRYAPLKTRSSSKNVQNFIRSIGKKIWRSAPLFVLFFDFMHACTVWKRFGAIFMFIFQKNFSCFCPWSCFSFLRQCRENLTTWRISMECFVERRAEWDFTDTLGEFVLSPTFLKHKPKMTNDQSKLEQKWKILWIFPRKIPKF